MGRSAAAAAAAAAVPTGFLCHRGRLAVRAWSGDDAVAAVVVDALTAATAFAIAFATVCGP